MTPRRKDRDPGDDFEAFDPEFDDDVFVAPDADVDAFDDAPPAPRKPRKPRKPRARKAASASPRRGRRALRVVGVAALALALIAFVISFVSGLGGGSGERVVGDAEEAGAELDRIGPRAKVEVLNAGGVAGLARLATDHLRDRGFDVVYMGNAGDFEQDSTVVIARTNDIAAATRIADALGTDSVVVEPDPQLFVDATVRLGKDWPRGDEPTQPKENGGGFAAWLRGLFRGE